MDLRNHKIWLVPVKRTINTGHHIDQETFRYTGTEQVMKVYKILAESKEMAIAYALMQAKNWRDEKHAPILAGEVVESDLKLDGVIFDLWMMGDSIAEKDRV